MWIKISKRYDNKERASISYIFKTAYMQSAFTWITSCNSFQQACLLIPLSLGKFQGSLDKSMYSRSSLASKYTL